MANIRIEISPYAIPGILDRPIKKIPLPEIIYNIILNEYYTTNIDLVKNKCRKRDIVEMRQISHFFSKNITNKSLKYIGKKIGKKDHATVLYSIKTVKNLFDTDKKFAVKLSNIYYLLSKHYYITKSLEEMIND